MFWSKKDTIKEYDCTDDLKEILQTRNLQIAISHSEDRAGYGFWSGAAGESFEVEGGENLLHGVIHFDFHRSKHIPATVRFYDEPATDEKIGDFLLFKPDRAFGAIPFGDPSIIYQNLLLDLTIHDKDKRIFSSLRQTMRDACLSKVNFVYIEFVIGETNIEAWFKEFQITGRPAKVPIRSLNFSDEIILPFAPAWSWKWK